MIEVEFKSRLTPDIQSKLQTKLQHMHFERTVHNVDMYYDTSRYDLLQQAVFVRIRNNTRLEFKFNEQVEVEHGQSIERSYALAPDAAQAEHMHRLFTRFLPLWQPAGTVATAIEKNSLGELARIDNQREEYTQDAFYLSLDHVKDLGDFIEVEVRCEEGADTSRAQKQLQAFVADLGIEHLRVGYVELWLQKYDMAAYRLGRYQL